MTDWEPETVEKSLSKMASSFYKSQLGINSIRDELKAAVDHQERIANALDRIADALEAKK